MLIFKEYCEFKCAAMSITILKNCNQDVFLVGTEEGSVILATQQYSSQYLMTYPAHATPIYSLQWNTFSPDLFITCAFEFIVKIWHKDSTNPIWRFDLGSQVINVTQIIEMNTHGYMNTMKTAPPNIKYLTFITVSISKLIDERYLGG